MPQRIKPQYKWPLDIGSEPLESELKVKRKITYKQGKKFHTEKSPSMPNSNAQSMRENGLYASGKKINTQKFDKQKRSPEDAMALLGEALRKAGL